MLDKKAEGTTIIFLWLDDVTEFSHWPRTIVPWHISSHLALGEVSRKRRNRVKILKEQENNRFSLSASTMKNHSIVWCSFSLSSLTLSVSSKTQSYCFKPCFQDEKSARLFAMIKAQTLEKDIFIYEQRRAAQRAVRKYKSLIELNRWRDDKFHCLFSIARKRSRKMIIPSHISIYSSVRCHLVGVYRHKNIIMRKVINFLLRCFRFFGTHRWHKHTEKENNCYLLDETFSWPFLWGKRVAFDTEFVFLMNFAKNFDLMQSFSEFCHEFVRDN